MSANCCSIVTIHCLRHLVPPYFLHSGVPSMWCRVAFFPDCREASCWEIFCPKWILNINVHFATDITTGCMYFLGVKQVKLCSH